MPFRNRQVEDALRLFACLFFLFLAAKFSHPTNSPPSTASYSVAALRGLALGETRAAGAIASLGLIQYLGRPHIDCGEALSWAELVADLDPHNFESYYFVGAFCFTDEKNARRLDALLARGQAELPNFELPLLRAFLAHFGTVDVPKAAFHYAAASRYPQAPPYISSLADRLKRDERDCRGVLNFAQQQNGGIALAVLRGCVVRQIELAAAAFRLKNGRDAASVEELSATGNLGPLPRIPGGCWILRGGAAELEPC